MNLGVVSSPFHSLTLSCAKPILLIAASVTEKPQKCLDEPYYDAIWAPRGTYVFTFMCVSVWEASKLNRTLCYTTNPFLTLLKLEWLQGLQALQLLLVIWVTASEEKSLSSSSRAAWHTLHSPVRLNLPAYSWQNLNTGPGWMKEGGRGLQEAEHTHKKH